MKKKVVNLLALILIIASFLTLIFFIQNLKASVRGSEDIPPPISELPSQLVYWLGLIGIILPFLYFDLDIRVRVLSLLLLSGFILLTYPLFSTYGFPYPVDPIYGFQTCDIIKSQGYWQPGVGTGLAKEYSHYPGMPFFILSASFLTGIELFGIYGWIVPLFRFLFLPLLLYLFFRSFLSRNSALLGIFLYLTCPSLINWTHHEIFTTIFLVATLYLLIKIGKTLNSLLILPVLLFSGVMVISHHFTPWVWLCWILFLYLFSKLGKYLKGYNIDFRRYLRISKFYVIFFAVIFLSWAIYNQYPEVFYNLVQVKDVLWDVLFSPVKEEIRPTTAGTTFTLPERIFLYSGIGLMGLYTLYGIILIWKKLKIKNKNSLEKVPFILIANFLFAIFLLSISAAFWPSSQYYIFLRVFEFAYLGIIPVALYGISKSYQKGKVMKHFFIPLTLLVILIGGHVMNGAYRYYYVDREKMFTDNSLLLTPEVYLAGEWFKENNKGGYVVGDDLAHGSIGGLSQVEIPLYLEEFFREVYGSPEISEELMEKLKQYNFNYLITNKYMSQFPCFFQFSDKFSQEELEKFDHSPYFKLVFNNSVIKIYEIEYVSD